MTVKRLTSGDLKRILKITYDDFIFCTDNTEKFDVSHFNASPFTRSSAFTAVFSLTSIELASASSLLESSPFVHCPEPSVSRDLNKKYLVLISDPVIFHIDIWFVSSSTNLTLHLLRLPGVRLKVLAMDHQYKSVR